jgi:hypothetical protein
MKLLVLTGGEVWASAGVARTTPNRSGINVTVFIASFLGPELIICDIRDGRRLGWADGSSLHNASYTEVITSTRTLDIAGVR